GSVTFDVAGAIGGVGREMGWDTGWASGWAAASGDVAGSLGAAGAAVAGAGVVGAGVLHALGVFGTGLEGSAGQALRPTGREEAPKSTGSPLPTAHEAPGPDAGHCFEPLGSATLATAGWACTAAPATQAAWPAATPPQPMPRMSCAAIVALGSLAADSPGAQPVAAARATIWAVTETSARRIAVAVRGLRPRENARVDDCNSVLPPGARPPRRAQIDRGKTYRRGGCAPAAARLITLNVCQ